MKKIFLLAAATLAMVACNNDDNYNNVDDPVAVHITATIGGSAVTRASETSWTNGDEIGITMVGKYANIKYTYAAESDGFAGTTMYFKNKRDPETLTAYYPFTGSIGTPPALIETSTTVDLQTSEEQPKFDFLYAKKENVTGSEPNVNLTFSHKMSKLTLTFKNGDGMDVSNIKSYTIDGLVLEGTFNTATGVCAAKADVAAAPLCISMAEGTVKNEVALPSLILFPQTPGKVTLKITDSGEQEYACVLNFGDGGIVSGNNYQYTIKVSKTGLSVNFGIEEWNVIDDLVSTAESE